MTFLVTLLTLPVVPSQATVPPFVRGVYGRDSSPSGTDLIAATGFNVVTSFPWKDDLDALHARGLEVLVWTGEYHRTSPCEFELPDEWIERYISEVAGHPAIAAYQVADEPNYARVEGCPDAAGDIRRRAELIRSIDPTKPTYVTISTWDGVEGYPYQHFAGATDIMGLVVYPCSYTWDGWGGCRFEIIDEAIAEADKDGIARYWAVLQDFEDGWYRTPTSGELAEQFDRWARSRMEGYFVYRWDPDMTEERHDHRAVLTINNLRFALRATSGPREAI